MRREFQIRCPPPAAASFGRRSTRSNADREVQGITSLMMSEESRALERGKRLIQRAADSPPEHLRVTRVVLSVGRQRPWQIPIPIISVPVASLDHRTHRMIIEHAGQRCSARPSRASVLQFLANCRAYWTVSRSHVTLCAAPSRRRSRRAYARTPGSLISPHVVP